MYNPSLRKIDELVLGYLKDKQLRAEEVGVKPLVLLIENRRLHELLVESVNAQRSPDWLYDATAPLYFAKLPGIELSVVGVLPPSHAFLTEIEVLKHLGARMFVGVFEAIGVGTGAGKLFLVESAACLDGASYRYSGGRREISASYRLHKFLKAIFEMEEIKMVEARAGSMDTPYLLLENDVQYLRANRVSLISFHIPPLYAFSFYSGCEAVGLAVTREDLLLKPKVATAGLYEGLADILARHLHETAFV
ncbi:MAG: hypothetical protein N3F63_01470 [Thermoplasmata archaeon]|nr:hypothetical protein [Thermoplasmata archaeon]